MSSAPLAPNPVTYSLRVAAACVLTLGVAAWFQMEHANLAVWTSFMVTTKLPRTTFQTSIERTLGRGVGILAAVVLVNLFPGNYLVRILFESVLMLVFLYGYFSGRFAYTLMNAALYLSVLLEMGKTRPAEVSIQGWQMFLAVVVGGVVSDVVLWLSWGEDSLEIEPGGQPLWPIRYDWVNHAVMTIVTITLTLHGCRFVGLPISQSIVSVMIITLGADVQAMVLKGEMRVGGAALGATWGLLAFLVLGEVPYFSILAGFVFSGIFVATYLSQRLGKFSYLGVQMGLVVPLVLVVSPADIGNMTAVLLRIEGVLIAMGVCVLVAGLWPRFPLRP